MIRQRVLTELSPVEKQAALVVLGRGLNETFKGLDIVPPQWAVIVEYDGIPLVASNFQTRGELIEYTALTRDHLVYGDNVVPICVPKRETPRQCFLRTMRLARGTEPVEAVQLAWLVNNYINGFLDGVVQYGGMKAAKQIALDYRFMSEPGWLPGEEWHYWNRQLETNTEGGMPRGS